MRWARGSGPGGRNDHRRGHRRVVQAGRRPGLRAQSAASSPGEVPGLGACDEDDLDAAMDWLLPGQE